MKIYFKNLPEELYTGAAKLKKILDYEISAEGIEISVFHADGIWVKLEGGKGAIGYREKHHFFRALGLFIEHARKEETFHIEEMPFFETVGLMLASTAGVETVDAVKRHLDYMALMGYNMLMLYTENTFEVESQPYFGYMGGRYSFEELKECDDYAYEYGIEMLPCIQVYGHMQAHLKWPAARGIKDTATVLLADSEETYMFLEDIIKAATAPYRSKRIHLGMDEAWDMGRGAYMDIHGYQEPFSIFIRHLKRVIEITNKYDLIPMIWSDMFFRICDPNHYPYHKDTVIPEEIKVQIPKEVQMVYWHYGEEPGCDDYMLNKHEDLGHDTIFAAGLWDWAGHFPENHYAFEATKIAIAACKKHGVKEMITTIWGANPGFSTLLGLSFTAEMAYTGCADQEYLRSRFEVCTKGNYDAFWAMSEYHNIFDDGREYSDFNDRFAGMALFWQDIMEGIFDSYLYGHPMSEHYKKYAEKMKQYDGTWSDLYRYAQAVFEYLYLKTSVAENLKPAYMKGNREVIEHIVKELLPAMAKKILEIHKKYKALWFDSYKVFGYSRGDAAYGREQARIATAVERLTEYLDGRQERLEELEEMRLPYPLTGFPKYPNLFV